MKVYKITYIKDNPFFNEQIGVQYTRDEELVNLLKHNKRKLKEDIEIEELELEVEE